MRILFISSIIIPWPPYVGTVLRSLSLIDALERLGNVDFLFFSDSNANSILGLINQKNGLFHDTPGAHSISGL